MTQPPQPPPPPGQPPSGGFGAPQEPSYGYPPQPPQAPGQAPPPPPAQAPASPPPGQVAYGYPQGGPYGNQAQGSQGYGYPGQQAPGQPAQPGPYANPYAQQPGGYPGMPQQPGGQQPGGGNQKRNQLVIIIAAVVAVALIIGAGIWFTSSGGGEDPKKEAGASQGADGGEGPAAVKGGKAANLPETKPASSTGRLLFNIPLPAQEKKTASVAGAWATEKTYAKVGKGEIVGYDLQAKKPKWKLPMDGIVCAASTRMTEEGKAAVIFEGSKRKPSGEYLPCSQIAVLDIDSGKFDWQKTMTGGQQASALGMGVTISQGVVVASWPGNGEAAYTITGKELWSRRDNGYDASRQCLDKGFGGGEKLVAVLTCGDYSSKTVHVQEVDPLTGKPKWTYEAPKGVKDAEVISTNGTVVVGIQAGSYQVTDMVAIDDSGKPQAQISMEDDKYDPNCGIGGGVEGCLTAVGDEKYLYLPSKSHDAVGGESFDRENEIVAFDLKTGSAVWKASSNVNEEIMPLRMAGDQLIAYQIGYDTGGQVLSVDPAANGKKTVYLSLPKQTRDAASSLKPDMKRAVYAHGRLFLNQDLMSGTENSIGEDDKYLGVAFGAN